MSIVDDLAASPEGTPGRKPRPNHPAGFVPGLNTQTGEIVARFDEAMPDDAVTKRLGEFLAEWGFDPDQFVIEDDRIEIRTWDAIISRGETRRFYYYKARIRRRPKRENLERLVAEIRRHRPVKRPGTGGEWTYVVALADWQLGKADEGGTERVVQRVLAGIDAVVADLRQARKDGWRIGRLVAAGLGDLVEGCTGQYPAQEWSVELDRRTQVKVARRLLLKALQTWVPLVDETTVVCVPGNHGENRQRGRAFTTPGDNDDVAVFEQVMEILAANPERYGHIEWHIPGDDLTVTVDLDGLVVGFAHGHQARGGGAGLQHTKLWNWWKNQAHGRSLIGDADVLVTGHYHYLAVTENGARTHIQAPSLDASDWYRESYGYGTRRGVLTFLAGPEGWQRLRIHRVD